MPAWAPSTRSVIGRLGSPKWPLPKMVVQTIVMETKNAPAAEKDGSQRAASHNRIGNSQVIGNTVSQSSRGSEMINAVVTASATSASTPSITSLNGGRRRTTEASPITSGATAMTPATTDKQRLLRSPIQMYRQLPPRLD